MNLKHRVHQHAFWYHSAVWTVFSKITITYNLVQNCWDKTENLFFREKTPLSSNQCCSESFSLLRTKLYQIQHWDKGEGGEFGIWKLDPFLQFLKLQIFFLTSVYQRLIWSSFLVKRLKLYEKNWFGGRDFLSLKNRFSIFANSFVQDCRLLIFFENIAPNCWMVLKCMLMDCMLQIQSIPGNKSDLSILMLILRIKIWYFWRLPSNLTNKTEKILFIFFKPNPNVFVASKIISGRIWYWNQQNQSD